MKKTDFILYESPWTKRNFDFVNDIPWEKLAMENKVKLTDGSVGFMPETNAYASRLTNGGALVINFDDATLILLDKAEFERQHFVFP